MMNHPPHADSQDTDGAKHSNLFLQQCSEHVMETLKADGTMKEIVQTIHEVRSGWRSCRRHSLNDIA